MAFPETRTVTSSPVVETSIAMSVSARPPTLRA